MEKIKIISKQQDVVVKRHGSNSFNIHFKNKPIEVEKNIAEFLLRNSNFEVYHGDGEIEVHDLDKFKKELLSLKGINEKEADWIVQLYTSKEDLINALQENHEMPFDEYLIKKLKKQFVKN